MPIKLKNENKKNTKTNTKQLQIVELLLFLSRDFLHFAFRSFRLYCDREGLSCFLICLIFPPFGGYVLASFARKKNERKDKLGLSWDRVRIV